MVVWPRLGDLFVSQNPREFYAPFSPGRILSCACTIFSMVIFKFLAVFPVDHLPHPVVSSPILFLL